MRWDALFADLEGRWQSLADAERDADIADLTRAERARIDLRARLRAHQGSDLELTVAGAGRVAGRLDRLGADWLLLMTQREVLVPLSAIRLAHSLSATALPDAGRPRVSERLGLGAALRALARDRSAVAITLVDGQRVTGTPDSVGQDWVDIAVHDLDASPRRESVREHATVALSHIGLVRRVDGWS